MTGPTSRVRESRRLQVGDMPEATGPLSLRPHGANPEATFSCLPASTEVTALEKKKAFLPDDTAVASRAERSAPAPQTRLPGPRDSMTRRAVRLASRGSRSCRRSGSLAAGIRSPGPLSPETPFSYLTESGFHNTPSVRKQKDSMRRTSGALSSAVRKEIYS